MGDILIHLASKMLRLLSLWSCGDRGSDLPQIPRPAGLSAQRSRAEPAPLRVDVAQFDLGITRQPLAALGLEDADRLADQRLADKVNSPAHLIWPLLRTRRTATSQP